MNHDEISAAIERARRAAAAAIEMRLRVRRAGERQHDLRDRADRCCALTAQLLDRLRSRT